jgi:NOL1/NOP2/fmu family ribosome biogenesis protein
LNEWSENNVIQCAYRQKKIIEDCWPALKEGGILIYSTCSFSKEEDENICQWITENLEAENVRLKTGNDWGVVESGDGYRFWPHKLSGEGFFIAVYRKTGMTDQPDTRRKPRMQQTSKSESAIAAGWLKKTDVKFIKHENTVYAWPQDHAPEIDFLVSQLKVIYSGIRMGDLIRDHLIPDHALAMYTSVNQDMRRMELNYENAIAYLQRKDIKPATESPGWAMATYEDFPLGWIKILSNRVNNYYPKELRILKENSGR